MIESVLRAFDWTKGLPSCLGTKIYLPPLLWQPSPRRRCYNIEPRWLNNHGSICLHILRGSANECVSSFHEIRNWDTKVLVEAVRKLLIGNLRLFNEYIAISATFVDYRRIDETGKAKVVRVKGGCICI